MINTERLIALLQEALSLLVEAEEQVPSGLVWGSYVSDVFKDRVKWIAAELGFDPNWLMTAIAFETAHTFSPSIRNAAGSGATGLIQFMPSTAKGLGTSVEALAQMTAEDQLKFVFRYFEVYKGRIKSLDDLYLAIFYPAAIGKPNNAQLFVKGGETYRQNAGLDANKDGFIRVGEITRRINEEYERGKGFIG
jgi:hypothetical protein